MADDDWFRSGDWDEAARELFESKLARARKSARSQYLRIKGLGLRESGELESARSLFLRVVNDHPDDWGEVRSAREHLAEIARDAGDADDAIAWYLQVLDADGRPVLSCTSGSAHLSLAQLYLDRGEYAAALEALNHVPVSELGLNDLVFRWNVVLADLSLAMGEVQVSQAAARRALGLLGAPDQFSRHPGIGTASAPDLLIKHLRSLEAGTVRRERRSSFARER